MLLQNIGQLLGVRPVERKDKSTGKIDNMVEATVQYSAIDEKGYTRFSTENISLDYDDYWDELSHSIGKYVCITYVTITTKNGAMFFPDADMPVLVFDKSPLDYSKYDRNNLNKQNNSLSSKPTTA